MIYKVAVTPLVCILATINSMFGACQSEKGRNQIGLMVSYADMNGSNASEVAGGLLTGYGRK